MCLVAQPYRKMCGKYTVSTWSEITESQVSQITQLLTVHKKYMRLAEYTTYIYIIYKIYITCTYISWQRGYHNQNTDTLGNKSWWSSKGGVCTLFL